MKKRILALALCLALVLGMTVPVYAEGTPPAPGGVEVTVEPDAPVEEPVEAPGEEPVEEPGEPSPEPSPAPSPTPYPEPSPTPELCEHESEAAACEQCLAAAQAAAQQETHADLYAALMAAEGPEELEALVSALTEEEALAFVGSLTEEQYTALEARITEIYAQNAQIPETVVFTDAGPFMPPIEEGNQRLRAARAMSLTQDENGLELSKTAEPDGDGYKIRLEAHTTGTVTTSTSVTPVDIILVLDQSGSMGDDFNGNSTNTNSNRRQYAMKQAVNKFISSVNEKYSTPNSDHRMALVTFGSDGATLKGWTFVDDTGKTALQSAMNGLPDSPSGSTNVAAGMDQAETLMGNGYNYTGENTTRQKVIIVFTDGMPTTGWAFDTTVASNAISTAKRLKDAGATVYSVGVFSGANPNETYGASGFDTNSNGTINSKWSMGGWLASETSFPEVGRPAGNRFLNFLSSNYLSAEDIGLKKDIEDLVIYLTIIYTVTKVYPSNASSYYLSANSAGSLDEIFREITENIEKATIDLGSTTVIKDVISPYFNVPENIAAIAVYTAAYNGRAFGNDEAASGVSATIEGNTISVTGFSFTDYFVSTTQKADGTYGKKLIIELTVTPRAGFWGGDGVPTNGNASGVYTGDGGLVESFEIPEVNVPLNVPDFPGNTVKVYYGGTAPQSSALYTPIPEPTGSDEWKDNFVTQGAYTVTGGPESTTQDGATYTVSMTASSGLQRQTKTATATIHVFLPQFAVTARDLWADYGVEVPLVQYGLVPGNETPDVAVTWMRGGITSTGITMANSQPAISNYTFTFAAAGTSDGSLADNVYTTGELDADFNVGLASCTVGSTKYPVPGGALTVTKAGDAGDNHDFTVHINKFKMTIRKTFIPDAALYKQDCIFTVSSDTMSFKVVIPVGGGSKTVVGLVCGKTYTVTEESSWSWRYSASRPGPVTCKSNVISNTQPTEAFFNGGDVGIANTLKNDKWLSGKDNESNLFAAKGRRRAARGEG